MARFFYAALCLLALGAVDAKKKGCGVEADFGGLCNMVAGEESCTQMSETIAFMPAFMRPPTKEEAQAMMDAKCDELYKAGRMYAIKKALKMLLTNPIKALKLLFGMAEIAA